MGRRTAPRICPSTPMQLSLRCGSAHEFSARVQGGSRFGSFVGGPTPGNVKLLPPPRQSPEGLSGTQGVIVVASAARRSCQAEQWRFCRRVGYLRGGGPTQQTPPPPTPTPRGGAPPPDPPPPSLFFS